MQCNKLLCHCFLSGKIHSCFFIDTCLQLWEIFIAKNLLEGISSLRVIWLLLEGGAQRKRGIINSTNRFGHVMHNYLDRVVYYADATIILYGDGTGRLDESLRGEICREWAESLMSCLIEYLGDKMEKVYQYTFDHILYHNSNYQSHEHKSQYQRN